jgi:hypothetical protein
VPLGQRVRLFAEGSYLGVVSSGELLSSSYFPRGRSFGVSARGGMGVRLFAAFELFASGGYDLYVHTFQVEPGDLYVASGASDAYLSGSLAVRLTL